MKNRGLQLDPATGDLRINIIRDYPNYSISVGAVVGDVTKQNQALIIGLHSGEIKTAPTVGVGISGLTLSHETLLYLHRTRDQIEKDGQHINFLDIEITADNKTTIKLNANY